MIALMPLEETWESMFLSLPLSSPRESVYLQARNWTLTRNQNSKHLESWTSQPLELWEIRFFCLSHPVSLVCCYSRWAKKFLVCALLSHTSFSLHVLVPLHGMLLPHFLKCYIAFDPICPFHVLNRHNKPKNEIAQICFFRLGFQNSVYTL